MVPDGLRAALITLGGAGHAPFASGSWASLVAGALHAGVAILVAGLLAPHVELGLNLITLLGAALASYLCVRWGAWAIARFGSTDPKPFVLDEFAGQWVALLATPPLALGAIGGNGAWPAAAFWLWLAGQFFLFRLFDVWKPPPARQLERLPAGWGVLCDDLMAGVYANLLGQIAWRLTPLPALLPI